MDEPNFLTQYGFDKLRLELDWLERTERPRIVAEVSWAASLGDRSENAEYIYGKKRLREIDGRRAFIVRRLEKGQLVDPLALACDVVRFGATVVIADENGEERTWRILGEDEVDIAMGILSFKSPLARALQGKGEGDTAQVEAPGGRRQVEIVEIRYEAAPVFPDNFDFSKRQA